MMAFIDDDHETYGVADLHSAADLPFDL